VGLTWRRVLREVGAKRTWAIRFQVDRSDSDREEKMCGGYQAGM